MTYIAYHSNTQRNTHSHCSEGGGSCGSGRLVRLDFISLPHSHTNSTVQFEDISTPMQDIPTALQEQPVQSNLQVCMKEIKLTNQLNLVTGKKSLPGHSCTVLTQVQSNFCPFPMQISWVQQLWEIANKEHTCSSKEKVITKTNMIELIFIIMLQITFCFFSFYMALNNLLS